MPGDFADDRWNHFEDALCPGEDLQLSGLNIDLEDLRHGEVSGEPVEGDCRDDLLVPDSRLRGAEAVKVTRCAIAARYTELCDADVL